MNGSLAANAALLSGIQSNLGSASCDVAVCVPAPYLEQCRSTLSDSAIAWGGQDVSVHESGAYTGEVSAAMLMDFDCTYVITGHSERRAYHGESDELVGRKSARALAVGLRPIVCLGETLAERESGQTEQVVQRQLEAVLNEVADTDLTRLVIAYDPVWAIGTKVHASPEQAQAMHVTTRQKFADALGAEKAKELSILYGGSVSPENAVSLIAQPDVDGVLVGGASLKAELFLPIIQAALAK